MLQWNCTHSAVPYSVGDWGSLSGCQRAFSEYFMPFCSREIVEKEKLNRWICKHLHLCRKFFALQCSSTLEGSSLLTSGSCYSWAPCKFHLAAKKKYFAASIFPPCSNVPPILCRLATLYRLFYAAVFMQPQIYRQGISPIVPRVQKIKILYKILL